MSSGILRECLGRQAILAESTHGPPRHPASQDVQPAADFLSEATARRFVKLSIYSLGIWHSGWGGPSTGHKCPSKVVTQRPVADMDSGLLVLLSVLLLILDSWTPRPFRNEAPQFCDLPKISTARNLPAATVQATSETSKRSFTLHTAKAFDKPYTSTLKPKQNSLNPKARSFMRICGGGFRGKRQLLNAAEEGGRLSI